MAKLFCRRRPCQHRRTHRHQLWHETNRGALCRLRCASGPRVSGWSRTNRAALLHEFGIPGLQAEEVIIKDDEVINRTKNNDGAPGVIARLDGCSPSLHRLQILQTYVDLTYVELCVSRGRDRWRRLRCFLLVVIVRVRFLIFLFRVAHFDAALEYRAFFDADAMRDHLA
jgi:hypothetical protein